MRTVSLVLALTFVLASSSLAGSAESGLPGVGTFDYAGPAMGPNPATVVTR
jgi:hypothetical protein